MRLEMPGEPRLTYCTNIHPGEGWSEVRGNLRRYAAAVKERVSPDAPFGVGLWLSARAARELSSPRAFEELRAVLEEEDLYVFTLNGFPHGGFHDDRVKERVYRPDWLEGERLEHTVRLAELLAGLLPPDVDGSISTVPGASLARAREAGADAMVDPLLSCVVALRDLADRTGKRVCLALEPEPCCFLETTAEAVRFFEQHLLSRAALDRLSRRAGVDRARSEALVRKHLGVCVDVCHAAVVYEDSLDALAAYEAAGIHVAKVQLSAGLKAHIEGARDPKLLALAAFAGSGYLHQVIERRAHGLVRYLDLPEALKAAHEGDGRAREWRVHFHVPIFRRALGVFENTQAELTSLLALVRERHVTPHLEVETYTWDVLPPELRRESVVDAVARELSWVVSQLDAGGATR